MAKTEIKKVAQTTVKKIEKAGIVTEKANRLCILNDNLVDFNNIA